MKKIEKRALMCLLLALVLFAGSGVFCYRYYTDGDDWASYEGNRDVYADGDLAKGALYDTNGLLLMKNSAGGTTYNESASIRTALMHITGDKDNNVTTGANRAFTDELIGYDFINGVYSLNNEGEDLTLTLDANVCATAYNALGRYNGTVGVYNYETGEIICMVSSPSYDPANPPSTPEEGSYINRFTSATFVPGSIFKLVTSAAAIENLDDAFTWQVDCTGSLDYGHGDKVTDLSVHGTVDLKKALQYSCNCYFARLSERLGAGQLEVYTEKLGLNESMDINGIKTAKGTFDYPESGIGLAWTGIGQWHDMINPCAMMVYMGAIANDGKAVMPYMISPSSFVGQKVKEISTKELNLKTKKMIEPSTAASLTDMMSNNITNTYSANIFSGLDNVCGKSGTAEVGGGKEPNAWFAGFLDDPENPYAFIVLVENGGSGTSVAGSVANKVLQDIVN